MKKIPVGATIAHAYRFAFGNFLKILGVMWLPMAVMWLPGILMRQRMMAFSAQVNARNFSGLGEMLWFLVPFYLAAMVLVFVQIIGIAQLALGRRRGPAWFFFSLGKPVWRLIGSFLLLLIAAILGWLAILLGDFLAGLLLKSLVGSSDGRIVAIAFGILTFIVMIAPWCALFYCLIRLSFLLTPVVAAEEDGFALAHSWTLGAGNFWRMFAILLVIVIPPLMLECAVLFGFMFRGISFPPPHAPTAQVAAYQTAVNGRALEMMTAIYHYWYISYPITIAVVVVFYGMGVGAQCFAYRALTEGASAPIAAD